MQRVEQQKPTTNVKKKHIGDTRFTVATPDRLIWSNACWFSHNNCHYNHLGINRKQPRLSCNMGQLILKPYSFWLCRVFRCERNCRFLQCSPVGGFRDMLRKWTEREYGAQTKTKSSAMQCCAARSTHLQQYAV